MVRHKEVEGGSGSPRQIRIAKNEIRIVNDAVREAALAYYGALGEISANNEVEGVEVERDLDGGTKELKLHLSKKEVSFAPERMRGVLADLGIRGRDNISVAVCLSEEPASRLDKFRLILRPRELTEIKFGINFGLWDAEVLTPSQMQRELNPWYMEAAQTYQELWQLNRSTFSRPNHHPAKAEIFGAGHSWIQQVVAGRRQLIERGIVREAGK